MEGKTIANTSVQVGLGPFHGSTIKSWKNTQSGHVFAGVAAVCHSLGVCPEEQRRKLKRHRLYAGALEACGEMGFTRSH